MSTHSDFRLVWLLAKIEDAARWDLPCEATSKLIAAWSGEARRLVDAGRIEVRLGEHHGMAPETEYHVLCIAEGVCSRATTKDAP